MIDKRFWKDKRVFITGHTGFKGSWLCLWLHALGAKITGYALAPPTDPSLFELCRMDRLVHSVTGDVRSRESLTNALEATQPEIIIHMAAQALVRESYKNPVETYSVNIMGTVNLFESVRKSRTVRTMINVTTDKCYENREWCWGYRENEPVGGYDPYSSSKACSELVTSCYRDSFFNPKDYETHGVAVATARAGNVIGGGDWAADRLVPDCLRAFLKGEKISIRNPRSIRPWQHVLEPLNGYLLLAQRLYEKGSEYAEAWNFGPHEADARTVEWVVKRLCDQWGRNASYEIDKGAHLHESYSLKLDCSKARERLGWRPRWNVEQALDKVIEWVRDYRAGKDVASVCRHQIEEYEKIDDDSQR
jgi:CDP-glucose 4,6-dehydratase